MTGDSYKTPLVKRAAAAAAAAIVGAIIVLVAISALLDAGHLQKPLMRFIVSRAGRPITLSGPLEVRLLSLNPRLVAHAVTLGNPPWMPAGRTAEIGKITLVFALPWFGRSFGVDNLELESASLHLVRLATGYANWQWSPPGAAKSRPIAIVRSLSAPDMLVELDDARRHLQFRGTVSIYDVDGAGTPRPLRVEGEGRLNARSATFRIDGDALSTASHATPYRFLYTETSSGTTLSGTGFLPQPFDFSVLDTEFNASGADLKDLYFLTGVSLVDTGAYRLSGKLARRDRRSMFTDLAMVSGHSDVRGTVSIDMTNARPRFDADLTSQSLRLADLGLRSAGRQSEAGPPLLLSSTSFHPDSVRRDDGVVNFHARHVEVGRQILQSVAAKMTIDHGILVLAPLSADVLGGKMTAHVRIDALTDNPVAELDLTIKDLQLAQLERKDAAGPTTEGPMGIRVLARGHGTSLHEAAASADGTVTAVLPSGAIRASFVELANLDLRGLGLLAANSSRQTAVHCGIASFKAAGGVLSAQSLILDTDLVLITGEGTIRLDTEALDLALRGHPKGSRLLRLRSPLLIRGTLAHPSTQFQAGASLAFVDPGLAKNADCAALLAAAGAAADAT